MMKEEQHDDHIWLTVNGTAWAIHSIRWPIIYLWRGYWPSFEFNAVDMSEFDSKGYIERALPIIFR